MRWRKTPFFARFFKSEPEDLPLSARIATVEGELLEVQTLLGKLLGTVKTLQGKVYRGVQLGETSSEHTDDPGPDLPRLEVGPGGMSGGKQDLYERAARLRGR